MKKDKTIIEFLERNQEVLIQKQWTTVDYWDADNCAIGIKKGIYLIYISTYNYLDEVPVRYDYELEHGDGNTVGKAQAVSENELLSILDIELVDPK